MGSVCPECGYNAGENGEKILELHRQSQHGIASPVLTPEDRARQWKENEIMLSRTSLILGGIVLLIGLGFAAYGASTLGILICPFTSSGSCFTPQSIVDQIRANGFRSVYVGAQVTAYGGLLVAVLGSMGISFGVSRGLRMSQKITLALLVGIFLLVLITAVAIADGFIPFGQRITYIQ